MVSFVNTRIPDMEYQAIYSSFPVPAAFFEAPPVLIRRKYIASWPEFPQYVRGHHWRLLYLEL
jgi:hypothetical protein